MAIRVLTWGERALFIRPEMEIDEVSYDMITPSAAKGILEAIYWTPEIEWVVDKIYVLNPIKYGRKEMTRKGINYTRVCLLDVCYVIEAHFRRTKKATQDDSAYYNIIMRRLKTKKPYKQPYFGYTDFKANIALCKESQLETAYKGVLNLSYMCFDLDFATDPDNPKPRFFKAILRDGVLDLTQCKLYR